ncbi:putative glycolipid-binding domain-containing protein [Sedimentitalea todarodis]|uniref:Glycolipid-binding domain-containing protein n=1 Tax=Sedimentitalea todarodis TaxID=1631240 RepID=A0ABU3VE88_9RHOB|nr:putative glycolipid-binding domain-containing protein [Sedimentitalea todarodis]MDU9004488.1 putative glycolipid-binding domain-containing protein [Sedimentitalea todarodis]
MIAGAHAVLWVKQDGPGNDACRFADAEGGYLIDGSSTGADRSILRYRIRARRDRTTRRARIGAKSRIFVRRAPDDTWTLNGTPVPAVNGAKDIDLGFTPATVTLPLRRLKLDVGDEAEIMVASLDHEMERLIPLHLIYRRIANDQYECLKTETGTTSHLSVDAQGIVRTHQGHWIAQA